MVQKWTPALTALMHVAVAQAGMVSRAQVLAHGFSDSRLRHQVRARRWSRAHPGVYATFTGSLPWGSRMWAAVLRGGDGAVLAGHTALNLWEPSMPGAAAAVRRGGLVIAVEERRRVQSGAGLDVWRIEDLQRHVHPSRQPPCLRFDAAVIYTASKAPTPDAAIAVIADACQARRTTPRRLLALLDELPANLRFRGLLREILVDVATGAYSYLEVHYLRDVERRHGLPTGARQRRVVVGCRPYFRDVEYIRFGVVVELDGRIGHEDLLSRADDMDRDTDSAHSGARTARLGYVQVMSRRCPTAQRVADLLRLGGWTEQPRRCGPGCTVH
jgi:hypothetical protein